MRGPLLTAGEGLEAMVLTANWEGEPVPQAFSSLSSGTFTL